MTVLWHRLNGIQIPYHPLDVDRTLSLRGILVLLIVVHHLSGVTSFLDLSPPFRMFISQFSFFGGGTVSMFFFISGYGLMVSLRKKGEKYLDSFYKKRFLKLLPSFLSATVFFICIRCASEHLSVWNICYEITSGFPPLPNSWYMYALFLLYIVFHAVFSIYGVKERKALIWMWIGSFIYIICISYLGWGYWWYTSILAFNIGTEYAHNEQRIRVFAKKHQGFLYVSLILFLLIPVMIYRAFPFDERIRIVSFMALNTMLPVAMVWVIQVLGIIKLPSINFLGRISYEVYLVHGIFIYLARDYYFSYGGIFIMTCVIMSSIVMAFMLNRISKFIFKFLK